MKKLFSVLFLTSALNAGWSDWSTSTKALVVGVPTALATVWGVKKYKEKRLIKRVSSQNHRVLSSVNPDTTAFTFDFHDVVAKRNYKIATEAFSQMSFSEKAKFLSRIAFYVQNRITKRDKRGIVADYGFIDDTDSPSYKEKAITMLNCFEPNEKGLRLIKELEEKGYRVLLCSNIGDQSVEYLKNSDRRFRDLFEAHYLQHPTEENGFSNKKDEQTYKDLQKAANGKQIVLIDDSEKKLAVAKKALGDRVTPIKFTSNEDLRRLVSNQLN